MWFHGRYHCKGVKIGQIDLKLGTHVYTFCTKDYYIW